MEEHDTHLRLREAIVAGIFYPEDPAELARRTDAELSAAASGADDAMAILSPHAGFDYCAPIQAAAWKSTIGRHVKLVVILAPYHRSRESAIFLPESDSFRTPLGDIAVDQTLCRELESCATVFQENDIPHFEEHSVELQLPFLQRIFPKASIVPILFGKPSPSMVNGLSRALDLVFGQRLQSTLFVVSSNLSAFAEADEATEKSDEFLSLIGRRDVTAILERESRDELSVCGSACIATLLSMQSVLGSRYELLARSDSASRRETQADHVVQYAAAAWFPERPS